MKFTDGNWMMQPGVTAHYPAEVYEAEIREGALDLYVPTRHIRHRGDTLQGPVLTVRVSSSASDVIRVKLSHYEGAPEPTPSFPLSADDARPDADWLDGLTLHAYALKNGQTVRVTVPSHDGEPALVATVTKSDDTLAAQGFSGTLVGHGGN